MHGPAAGVGVGGGERKRAPVIPRGWQVEVLLPLPPLVARERLNVLSSLATPKLGELIP